MRGRPKTDDFRGVETIADELRGSCGEPIAFFARRGVGLRFVSGHAVREHPGSISSAYPPGRGRSVGAAHGSGAHDHVVMPDGEHVVPAVGGTAELEEQRPSVHAAIALSYVVSGTTMLPSMDTPTVMLPGARAKWTSRQYQRSASRATPEHDVCSPPAMPSAVTSTPGARAHTLSSLRMKTAPSTTCDVHEFASHAGPSGKAPSVAPSKSSQRMSPSPHATAAPVPPRASAQRSLIPRVASASAPAAVDLGSVRNGAPAALRRRHVAGGSTADCRTDTIRHSPRRSAAAAALAPERPIRGSASRRA